MKNERRKKGSERGFIKLVLAVIGLLVILTIAGVKLSIVQNIAAQIWREIILPVVNWVRTLLSS